jgi:nucleoside-diphosphate-sugar epimerase
MPRALIAGCGYLGQAVADLLVANDWTVEGWTKSEESASKLDRKQYSIRAVDVSDEDQVRAQTTHFDAVIHCASTRGGGADSYCRVYLDGATNLLGRFNDSRILFTSSTSVYAQTNGEVVTEAGDATPTHDTGKILRAAEDLVLMQRGIVIRLGGIYGPGRSALLRKFLNNEAIIDPENDRFVNQIHRDDAATAILLLLKRGDSIGQIFNVVDNEPILQGECYRWLAAKLNRPLPASGRSTSPRKRGQSNKRVSNEKLRGVGWTPRYPTFAEGIERSVLPNLNREGA